jgi:hypothetical protein
MFARMPCFCAMLAAALAMAGCATQTANRRQLAAVRTVGVNYGGVAASSSSSPGTGERVLGQVAYTGAGYALSSVGLGPVASLLGLATSVVRPSGRPEFSPEVLAALSEARVEPYRQIAHATEQEIRRRRLFEIRTTNPEAVFGFEIRRLDFKPVDKLGLGNRLTLAVVGRLRVPSGAVIWSKEAGATAAMTRTWQDYAERPQFLRSDFEGVSAVIARELLADFGR